MSAVIYARVPDPLKQTLQAHAAERGLNLTHALVELVERGLLASAQERSLAQLERTLAAANSELDKTREPQSTFPAIATKRCDVLRGRPRRRDLLERSRRCRRPSQESRRPRSPKMPNMPSLSRRTRQCLIAAHLALIGASRSADSMATDDDANVRGVRQSRSLRIGLLHLAPEAGAVERNRALIEKATTVAAEMGADWVLSGELVVSGYRFQGLIGTDWITSQPDAWLRRLADLTASLGVVSFVSHPERENGSGKLFNTLFVIGRDAEVLARHQKLHPTPEAEAWSSPGRLADPIEVDGMKVGLLICADAYASEPALRLRQLGAELLISAAAWWPGECGPQGEWEARTMDTGLPIIVCNRTGVDGDSRLTDAESVVIDGGDRLATFRSPDSAVFVIDCQISDGRITECAVANTAHL